MMNDYEDFEVWYSETMDEVLWRNGSLAVMYDELLMGYQMFPIENVTEKILKQCGWERVA